MDCKDYTMVKVFKNEEERLHSMCVQESDGNLKIGLTNRSNSVFEVKYIKPI